MKRIKNIITVLFVSIGLFSCSDSYLDVNEDPNNPTEVGAELMLPVAQVYSANTQFANRYTNTLGNMLMYNWSQSDGFSWYYDEFEYQVNATFYDRIFDYSYGNTLKQYQALANLEGAENANYVAIAEIMKAFHMQILVDAYGDVPYSEALQRGDNPTPGYDDAETIYDDLIVKLTNAIAMINNADETAVIPGEDDIMFGGNMTSWKQFANTVKLRILVRQSGMASKQAYITTEMNAIMNEGSGFITNNVAVNPGYLNEEGKQSPFYAAYGLTVAGETQNNGQATCASDYVVQKLINFNDPRIDRLYTLPVEPLTIGHVGIPQGVLNYPADDSWEPEHVSLLGPGVLSSPQQDATIFTLDEALFLQAEAAQRNLMTGDAQSLYESAITASFNFLGAGDASAYYSQSIENVGWNASSDKIEAIITQKWIALNGTNGFESWIEYNRTGFPSDVPVSMLATTPDRPVRLAYPNSEVTSNSGNLPNQPDVFNTKIFWAN
ncbi:SusD/RagB family nutrient-binding outer membrane lipoprotein [Mangrovimonas spongiae]|uniref:SusD/RagB family nutrient-binding outer membrane lipoprotein n=1 Tax=Mangrovimonas spongiae TaxID=2494697 RepID=A0A3R9NUI5_9FLAO|nr:SusD/RagB family nutrient-binding outer membrane lipoprotein [Mangrovimonas spongiae]RSK42077.1 SusD/RagB family nutrient-binding outer membrane lipoprotein [Mangrovimonas spongiae]